MSVYVCATVPDWMGLFEWEILNVFLFCLELQKNLLNLKEEL